MVTYSKRNKAHNMLTILVISTLFIQIQCNDYKSIIRDTALEFTRFNLAQRVDSKTFLTADISIDSLLNSSAGLEELRAIDEYLLNLVKLVLPENVTSEDCDDSECYNRKKYIFDQGQLLAKEFSIQLSLGIVRSWPKYYYDQGSKSIKVLPELLQVVPDLISTELFDYGPETPEFGELQELSEEMIRYEALYKNKIKWIPETPENLQDPDLYELNYIIPLSILGSFYDLFCSALNTLDGRKRQKVLGPIRILQRSSEAAQRIRAAENLGNDDDDVDDEVFSESLDFDYDVKKHFLWAPGNLYYGFKNVEELMYGEGKFEARLEVIMGKERFRKAKNIYERASRFVSYAEFTAGDLSTKEKEARFTEMQEIFYEILYFGMERKEPYLNDRNQWRKIHGRWELKSIKDYKKSLNDYFESAVATENSAITLFEGICYSLNRESHAVEPSKYNELEDSLIRVIMTDKNHTSLFFQQFQSELEEVSAMRLPEINDFLRKVLHNDHQFMNQECTRNIVYCSRIKKWCNNTNNEIILKSDEVDNPMTLEIDILDVISSTSFPDWCNGQYFNKKNKITTDSAFYRIMTFNATQKNRFNTRTVMDLQQDFFISSHFDNEETFFDYIEDQLQKINSKANQILNKACDEYKKPLKAKKPTNHRFTHPKPKAAMQPPPKDSLFMRILKGILTTLEGGPTYGPPGLMLPDKDELRR